MPYAYLQREREPERDLRAKLGVGAAPLAEEVAHAVGGRRAWAEGEDAIVAHVHLPALASEVESGSAFNSGAG